MPTLPTTIDEVLAELDHIIGQTISDNNYLGIFAYVYRRTTAQIKSGIEAGAFEDNGRMEAFDVAFANLYIDAFRRYHGGFPIRSAWRMSFEAANRPLTITQHLMLGMNAHINLDLCLAASTIMEGKDISLLRSDFRKVNDILFSLTNEMQRKLSKVSFFMFLLDWIGKRSDERIIDFSIQTARDFSWNNAVELAHIRGADRKAKEDEIDRRVAAISNRIIQPKAGLTKFVLKVIQSVETKNVGDIIKGLEK